MARMARMARLYDSHGSHGSLARTLSKLLLVPLYKDGIKIQCYMKLLTGRIQNLDRTRLDQPVPIPNALSF